MENTKPVKIKSFTQLIAWQEGHKLVLMIYTITKNFPKEELFGLSNQIRRQESQLHLTSPKGFLVIP